MRIEPGHAHRRRHPCKGESRVHHKASFDTIMIPPGKYQVVRQREYSPRAVREAYRYVAD